MLAVRSIGLAVLDAEWGNSTSPWYYLGASREVFIVLLAVTAAALVAIIWVLFFYRSKRPHSHHRRRSRRSFGQAPEPRPPNGEALHAAEATGTRRWRRRRRDHRPRNPTLAETRGLPPMREERPPEPLS